MTAYRTGRPIVTRLQLENAPAMHLAISRVRAAQAFSVISQHRGFRGLGDVAADGTITPPPAMPPIVINPFVYVLEAASVGLSAYHGYKRNNSVGWAIWWGLMGGLFPIITPVIAFAQGFSKRAGR